MLLWQTKTLELHPFSLENSYVMFQGDIGPTEWLVLEFEQYNN